MRDNEYLKLSSSERITEAKNALEKAKKINKPIRVVPAGFTFNKINKNK